MREQAGFDMILLDLDGTLIDSEKGIVNSVIYALEKFGMEKEREELLPFIGPPLVHSFREYTGLGGRKLFRLYPTTGKISASKEFMNTAFSMA